MRNTGRCVCERPAKNKKISKSLSALAVIQL